MVSIVSALSYWHLIIWVDESLESLERRATEAIFSDTRDDIPQPTSVTFVEYEDPFSLVEESSGAPHISTISKNAWVGCGNDIYVLECLGKGYVRVEPVEGSERESSSLLRVVFG